jgi:hypothetical protein
MPDPGMVPCGEAERLQRYAREHKCTLGEVVLNENWLAANGLSVLHIA